MTGFSGVTTELHKDDGTAGTAGDLIWAVGNQSSVKTYLVLKNHYDVVLKIGSNIYSWDAVDCTGDTCAIPPSPPDGKGPLITNVLADPNPAPVNTAVTLTARVDDSTTGNSNIASAEYSPGDGSWTAMAAQDSTFDEVSEDVTTVSFLAPSTPGVYDLCVRGTDALSNIGDPACIMFVVYDPSAGFVTGGGWIDSPKGAYAQDPSLSGRANFGFVSRYRKGAQVPTGNTEFQFRAAGLNFHSSSYEWLVVTGSNYARYKGAGTINGEGNYKFMLWAGDGSPDTFRIMIWTEDDLGKETVIYDNGVNQAIGGGSIAVHTGK